ncbi:hypothetical protein HPB48_000908 [Haemaphysalis longicornis]|uniref:Uncharacterized protein n=1 Tax=Haemaphysalis longicornis TaxID=44386 RepID=A0A9J6GY87_HAELO|nr:hypothetical protein HPB48_000908 [Haemaphysalis longicornis]
MKRGAILTAQTREAAVGSQRSLFTCTSHRFLRFGLAGKRNIRVPFLQWFVHCGTQQPGIFGAHTTPHTFTELAWSRKPSRGQQKSPRVTGGKDAALRTRRQ